MKNSFSLLIGTVVLLRLIFPCSCYAFYTTEGESTSLSLRGTFMAGAGYAQYPEDSFLYSDDEDFLWNSDLRLVGEALVGEHFRADVNLLQNVSSAQKIIIPGTSSTQREVERSSLFYWQQHDTDNTQAFLTLDSGSISLSNISNELTIGRQPVNQSVTFYFTPNDFFAPFAPQNFYREYKPGVDALRFERRLADLSQLTLLAVLGYSHDTSSDSGWSRVPEWQRTSLVGRMTHILGEYEVGFLGGTLADYIVLGASVQGDLFNWLGVRAEWNYRDTWKDDLVDGLQVSLGLEHQFSGSLIARFEQYYNGQGYESIRQVNEAILNNTLRQGYLGRNYSAFAVSYEFTPLLTGDFLFLYNWTDDSQSYSFYGLYSLSDESELALSLNFSPSCAPDRVSLNSEFGVLPTILTLEYRVYF